MKTINRALVLCIMLLCFVSVASADFYYEVEMSGEMLGQTPGTGKNYVSATGMRMDSGSNMSMILNFKTQVFYQMNLANKTYTETPFDQLMNPEGEDQEQAAKMAQMVDQMMKSLKVTKTEEKQTINEYKCVKYIVEGMGMESIYWVTKDVKNYQDLGKYLDKYKEVFNKSPVLKQLSASFEMQRKMDGFPVKTINKMMGMETISTVTKIENKKIGEDVFMPPKDFTKGGVEAK